MHTGREKDSPKKDGAASGTRPQWAEALGKMRKREGERGQWATEKEREGRKLMQTEKMKKKKKMGTKMQTGQTLVTFLRGTEKKNKRQILADADYNQTDVG